MEEVIRSRWGDIVNTGAPVPNSLRDFQVDLMAMVINGENCVVKAPTGAGKSLPLIFLNSFLDGLFFHKFLYMSYYLGENTGVLIVPLLGIESQIEQEMKKVDIPYVILSSTKVENLAGKLEEVKPHIILTSPEALAEERTQRVIHRSKLHLNYIAVDEGQVRGCIH